MFFIVHNDHNVILGTTDVPYTSFNSYFVEVADTQVEAYERLAASLPADHYVELSDIVRQSKQFKSEPEEHRSATPEFRNSVANMFKSKPREGKTK